jgi:hypothetical protein
MPQDGQLVGTSGGTHVVRVEDTAVLGGNIDLAHSGLVKSNLVSRRDHVPRFRHRQLLRR